MKKNTKITIIYLTAILIVAPTLWLTISPKNKTSSNAKSVKIDSGQMLLMGTVGQIKLYATTPEIGHKALQLAKQALKQVDEQMSTYRKDSELSKINQQAGISPQKLSPQTLYLLQKAQFYAKQTAGHFDITVSPLITLWKTSAQKNKFPTQTQITACLKNVGYQKIVITETPPTISFTNPNIKLNVNAIAKGYAIDQALAATKIPGVTSALVNIGGDIACFGQDWKIGIQDPFAPDTDDQLSQSPKWFLTCKNKAVATSGNYRRYKTIEGQKISHIINPITGFPAEKLPSVTIIADKCIDADALATAVSVLGPKEGLKLINSINSAEAFLIAGTPESPIFYSSKNLSKYQK